MRTCTYVIACNCGEEIETVCYPADSEIEPKEDVALRHETAEIATLAGWRDGMCPRCAAGGGAVH